VKQRFSDFIVMDKPNRRPRLGQVIVGLRGSMADTGGWGPARETVYSFDVTETEFNQPPQS
jgi:hypothetical protein